MVKRTQRFNGKSNTLTQDQPWLNDTNFQVQAKVLHVTTASPAAWLCFFHSMNSGISPCFCNFLSSQRCHPGALLPEILPGECLNFPVKGVHSLSSG